MAWQLEYDAATPLLPEPIGLEVTVTDSTVRVSQHLMAAKEQLPEGCYLVRVRPEFPLWSPIDGNLSYDGTFRLQWNGAELLGSGDLYLCRSVQSAPPREAPWELDPAAGIPIFPREHYRYYVRLVAVLWKASGVLALSFEMYRFDKKVEAWSCETTLTAEVVPATAKKGYPAPPGRARSHYMEGSVRNPSGTQIAKLEMGWVSSFLRKAVLEIDAVRNMEIPRDNGAGIGWKEVYEHVGWLMEVKESQSNLEELQEPTEQALHAHMLKWRSETNLDKEWRYHLLCVGKLPNDAWGLMYDSAGSDLGNVPREGAAVAARREIPNEAIWEGFGGQELGKATAAYFRTAVHEIGHAQHLFHRPFLGGFMQSIFDVARRPGTLLEEIEWSFSGADLCRLRHLPDPWVRPGGLSWGHGYLSSSVAEEDLAEDAKDLQLEVSPHASCVLPLGAPLRLNLKLKSTKSIQAPKVLSLKSGMLSGEVVDPAGRARPFSPLVLTANLLRFKELPDGGEMCHDMTLLRGMDGALLPAPGYYEIVVRLGWDTESSGRRLLRLVARTHVLVQPAEDEEQAQAALAVFSTPELMLPLVFGAGHDDAAKTLDRAMASTVLKPHYLIIQAKLLAGKARTLADFEEAVALLDDPVLTPSELLRAAEIVRTAVRQYKKLALESQVLRDGVDLLTAEIHDLAAPQELVQSVSDLINEFK